jgi:quercetin dioxygenase-like cupin family protein
MSVPYVARAATQQRIAWIGGSVHHVVLDAPATSGRLVAFRSSMSSGAASPVHVHDREDETVFVLAGRGTFWAGEQRWELGSGDTAFLPRGVPHTYAFTSDTADLITVCNPAGMEEFFRAAGWDLSNPQPEEWAVDMDTLRVAAESCGQRVLGPPLRPGDEMPAHYFGGNADSSSDDLVT